METMRRLLIRGLCLSLIASALALLRVDAAPLPEEPVEIGTQPQFFVDDYLVDNRWGEKYRTEVVRRVFLRPASTPAIQWWTAKADI